MIGEKHEAILMFEVLGAVLQFTGVLQLVVSHV
jgi:hypothetical protein